jgi:hypothetical protein
LRPGDFLELPYTQITTGIYNPPHTDGVACSVGYAFTDSHRRRFVSTAGHCAGDVPLGTVALDRERRPVGRLVFSVREDPTRDFALVQLFPSTGVDPRIPGMGTPRRIFTARETGRREVRFLGQGLGVSALGVRTGFVSNLASPEYFRFVGAVNAQDSGGPVVTADGQALGIIIGVTGGPNAVGADPQGADVGTAYGARLKPLLDAAQRALKVRLHFAQ